ncbi:MAG: hypothetical protein PHV42_04490, partial [Candidatus Pacebacteria bacterium]|nr:hypothetical protein [Candidatus Paceibacterota bacterium]
MREAKIQNLTDWKERLVGIEYENPVVDRNGNPVTLSAMQNVWKNLEKRGWKANLDPFYKLFAGAEKEYKGATINLISDNGAGNFEIALPPLPDIHEAETLLASVHKDIVGALRKENLSYLGIGLQPGTPGTPIDEYRVKNILFAGFNKNMEPAGGPHSIRLGNGLFFGLSAHQTGVSLRLSEMLPAINELIKTTGLITALCANSSIQNWEILPWKEWRIPAYPFRFVASQNIGFGKSTSPRQTAFTSLADFFKYYW